ncbi:MAG: M23 family metallopeptidase [Candidatus Nanopelagicales bacterium]|jgi:murein DD-endopeptidase MepM/ murein hydrolase activator NlpD|nr:M23 family metallopeptidase [Candidatus Nanopelagicales bacterium]MCU0298208.1 M23 family metallopeptidase [Candidatus Nanopelagicales bacterium]
MITTEGVQKAIVTSGVAIVAGALVVGAASSSTANPVAKVDPAVATQPSDSPLDFTPDQMALAAKKAKQMEIAAAKRAKLRAQRSSGPMFTPTTNFHYSARFGQAGGSWSSGHHTGLDFAAPSGTPVFSALAGKVVEAGWGGAYGNHIIVRHDNGVETLYAHLTSANVNAGDRVLRGQRIGSVGSTGNSSGPHLHFEVLKNGTQRDPAAFL